MAAFVLLLCGVLLLLAAAHPFITYPLSLLLFRPEPMRSSADAASLPRPSVAICLSVYNEEAVIVDKIESLLAQAALYGPATIHVYADGCEDDTVSLMAPYRDRIDLIVSNARCGKTHGMALLIARSASELIVFTDANVRAPDQALVDLAAAFQDPRVGCASAQLAYANPGESAISLISSIYWWVEEKVKAAEDRTVGMIGVDGAMFMIRRANYHVPPTNLIDDLYVSLRVLLDGLRVVRVPHVIVTERSATGIEDEYRRKARISCQAMNVHRDLWPGLRKLPFNMIYGYISHRLLKWMMPFLMVGATACFLGALIVIIGPEKATIVVSSALLIFFLGLAIRFRPAQLLWATIAAIAGTGKGVLESVLAGKKYVIWEPVSSVRAERTLAERPQLGR